MTSLKNYMIYFWMKKDSILVLTLKMKVTLWKLAQSNKIDHLIKKLNIRSKSKRF